MRILWGRLSWRVVRWPLLIVGLFGVLVLIRIPSVMDRQATMKMVAQVHASRLSSDDIAGTHLPPAPDVEKNDAVLAGIDANHNGIRDDVELTLFAQYPVSSSSLLPMRAAALQYAKALQRYLTVVTNGDTLTAVIQEDERGSFCIRDTIPKPKQTDNDALWDNYFSAGTQQMQHIEDLVLNTPERKQAYQDAFKKYMTSYGSIGGAHCDLVSTSTSV